MSRDNLGCPDRRSSIWLVMIFPRYRVSYFRKVIDISPCEGPWTRNVLQHWEKHASYSFNYHMIHLFLSCLVKHRGTWKIWEKPLKHKHMPLNESFFYLDVLRKSLSPLRMVIKPQPIGTRLDPTLLGQVLPNLRNSRVGFGF